MKKRRKSALISFVLYMGTAGFLFFPADMKAGSYANMGCYDLWYARNAIFARKGYCFEKRQSINVFGRRCYPPYGRLNKWERREVDEIKYWERSKGCSGGYVRPSYSTPAYSGSRYARVVGISWNDTLAVRSGPSTGYPRIGDLPPDARGIEILRCMRKWCKIRYGNLVGWSYAGYLRSY